MTDYEISLEKSWERALMGEAALAARIRAAEQALRLLEAGLPLGGLVTETDRLLLATALRTLAGELG